MRRLKIILPRMARRLLNPPAKKHTAARRNRREVRAMAWGIFMTFMTLFGMMVLVVREAATPEGISQTSSENVAPEGSAYEKPDLPKAA